MADSKEYDALLAGLPLDAERVFSAPWEARAFAIAVQLSRAGLFSWDEFRERLIAEIAIADRAAAHGWEESGPGYYTYFYNALEQLLAAKGIVAPAALERQMEAIAEDDHDHHHDD